MGVGRGTVLVEALSAFALLCALHVALGFGLAFAQPAGGSLIADPPAGPVAAERPHGLEVGTTELGAHFAISIHSGGGDIDQAVGSGFAMIGLRYGKVLEASRKLALEYVVDVVPLAVVSGIPKGVDVYYDRVQDRWVIDGVEMAEWSSVYGFGASPLGLQLYLLPSGRIRLWVGGTAGFLFFARDVPVPGGTALNFAFDFRAGLQFSGPSDLALSLGFEFHHFSNGGLADVNPGLDTQFFYAGISRFR
ncbi:MAG: acyloxyacyl hydrolase [Gemmatimonadota bacterium]|nr:MAG: acyloxyacyl hydrolase [Gemmatimonadota bacterium]